MQDRVELDGRFGEKDLRIGLVRRPEPAFLLTNRGFRWISEGPLNR